MRKKFTTSLDDDLIIRIKVQAAKERTDVSKILEILIEEYLKRKEIEPTE